MMKYVNRISSFLTLLTLLCTCHTPISTAKDETEQSLSLPDGAVARIGKGVITEIEYSPDGMHLAVASKSGIWIYDAVTFQPIKLLVKKKMHPEHIAYKHDGSLLATYDNCREIRLWDTETGTDIPQMGKTDADNIQKMNLFMAFEITISADRKTIASVDIFDKNIKLWDIETGDEKIALEIEGGKIELQNCLAFSPDGFLLAAGNEQNTLSLWDTVSGEHKYDFIGHNNIPISLAFSLDGNTLVSSSSDKSIFMWNTDTGEQIRKLTGNQSYVDEITYSVDGSLIAGGTIRGTIHLWDANTGAHIKTFKKHVQKVNALAFSPDLRTMVSGGMDGKLYVWNIITGEMMRTVAEDYIQFSTFDFSHAGKTITSPSYGIGVYIWDTTTGALQNKSKNNNLRVTKDFSFSPDQKTFAMVRNDEFFRIVDLETDRHKDLKFEHDSQVICVAFSRDGKMIASGTSDNTVHIWDADTAEKKLAIREHGKDLVDVAFSPDGKFIATAGYNRNIYLWHVDTGKRKMILKRHKTDISSVAFSPDGKLIAFGDKDGNITICDSITMIPLKIYEGDHDVVKKIKFTLDGKRLVSLDMLRYVSSRSSQTGVLYMWDIGELQ